MLYQDTQDREDMYLLGLREEPPAPKEPLPQSPRAPQSPRKKKGDIVLGSPRNLYQKS